ncbi:MAG: hypothetical protein HY329_09820 [Chloroflexi bacterium]|nr:hypothetical protein [Chloroflexota bacterium]
MVDRGVPTRTAFQYWLGVAVVVLRVVIVTTVSVTLFLAALIGYLSIPIILIAVFLLAYTAWDRSRRWWRK